MIKTTKKTTPPRFRDFGKHIGDYQKEFLVECPQCAGCAHIRSTSPQAQWSLVCAACGHFARWSGDSQWETYKTPSGCGLPLWLRTTCRGRPVWAYNAQHLTDLRAFAKATHRGRGLDPIGGKSSRSMIAALPAWMISGKNREDVVRALKRLERKLEELKK